MYKNHKAKYTPKVSAAESRFIGITKRLRGVRNMGKSLEKDIAFAINKIQQYGFGFFPNHYLWEDLNQLEVLVNKATSEAA